MTHSHPLDFALVEAALARDDWRYLGMIGSRAKRAQLERRLAARGTPVERIAFLTCPIGTRLRGLEGKTPGSIALAVAVELCAVRAAEGRKPASLGRA
jgi:xanthine dehydrogenase accessory factor